jgi:hypothetical protein
MPRDDDLRVQSNVLVSVTSSSLRCSTAPKAASGRAFTRDYFRPCSGLPHRPSAPRVRRPGPPRLFGEKAVSPAVVHSEIVRFCASLINFGKALFSARLRRGLLSGIAASERVLYGCADCRCVRITRPYRISTQPHVLLSNFIGRVTLPTFPVLILHVVFAHRKPGGSMQAQRVQ